MTASETIRLGFSPCPNDTFMFFAIASGELTLPGREIVTELHDVETLNCKAMMAELDISKLSFHAWMKVRSQYRLLSSGAALGYGCGPLVVSKKPLTRADMTQARVVLPGQWTTAHLLFRLWAPEAKYRAFTTYENILSEIEAGRADCGVIIHENRFTYSQAGFLSVIDLGARWEKQTGLPIPLGCIAAKEELGDDLISRAEDMIRRSIRRSQNDPSAALPYIHQHAQELSEEVTRQHIHTFVNPFSIELGETGRAAVDMLTLRAKEAGII
jgi:1,4-dihydroxy-6-naphthoate synthase